MMALRLLAGVGTSPPAVPTQTVPARSRKRDITWWVLESAAGWRRSEHRAGASRRRRASQRTNRTRPQPVLAIE